METRNCIIIHGCPSNAEKALDPKKRTYDKHWIPWTKKALEKNGIETLTPRMPEPWQPDYQAYKNLFDELHVNEQTTLIGHSCGCAFLVRWLGETKRRIDKLILVAPWKVANASRVGPKTEFYTFDVDPRIPSRVNEIVMFTADNEEEDGKKSLKMYYDVLGGNVIELKGHGHYCLKDMGTEEFPGLIQQIL